MHVVWEKFCRYFDVEPRIVPLKPDKYTIGPEDVEPHIDENTIGVAAVLGTTFTGHADDIPGINDYLVTLKDDRGLDVPLHVDAASGGFVWPFLYPHSEWDFRLEQVRSINVSGHKFGLVYPGIGWLVFREKNDLPEDLVFYENYLGKRDATFTLNFSTGSAMVLAQYYNFVRLGHDGYRYVMETMKYNARTLGERDRGDRRVRTDRRRARRAASARRVQTRRGAQLRRVRRRRAARGRARLDGARLHAAAQRRTRQDHARARQADARPLADDCLGDDIAQACETLEAEGRPARVRPQARQDEHRLLIGARAADCRGFESARSRTPSTAASGARLLEGDQMRGVGSALFVGILLMVAGILNIVYGIAAVGDSNFFVNDTQYVFSSLHTWGWITIILGVIQLTGSFSLFAGNVYGRVIGIVAATLGAIGALLAIVGGAHPWWSLGVFAICLVCIHGLIVLGEPEGVWPELAQEPGHARAPCAVS